MGSGRPAPARPSKGTRCRGRGAAVERTWKPWWPPCGKLECPKLSRRWPPRKGIPQAPRSMICLPIVIVVLERFERVLDVVRDDALVGLAVVRRRRIDERGLSAVQEPT